MSGAHENGQDSPARSRTGAREDRTGPTADAPALFLVKGAATAEEVAALTVVLHSVAAANARAPEREVRSEWSSHHRKVRPSLHAGPGGWRSSGLPR